MKHAPIALREFMWYGTVIALVVIWALVSSTAGFWLGVAAPAGVILFLAGLTLLWRRPEIGVAVLLFLVSFGNEYSQTDWGVRSAEQLVTIYNWQIVPGLVASPYDLLFAGIVAVWLGRKRWRRERLAGPPGWLWVALLLSAGFTLYALILGLSRLPAGFELYYILRELRPLLFALIILVMTVDVLTIRGGVDSFWRLTLALALIRGLQGIGRHLAGIGRSYYGTTMVYYDYSDSILLFAGLSFLLAWLLSRPRWRARVLLGASLAAAPIAYAFLFSFRRSFWIGAATSLGLLFFYVNQSERRRYLGLIAVGGLFLLAFLALDPTGQLAIVGQRVASITDAEGDTSNYFRLLDTANSLNAVYESAGAGLGFGSRYRVVATIHWLADFINHVSRASHNGYLYLGMKMGLPGLAAWTALWLGLLGACYGLWRRPTGRFRVIGLGVTLLLVACAVANAFLPLYFNLRPMTLLALFGGLAVAACNRQRLADPG